MRSPNVILGMLSIHAAITRGLEVALAAAERPEAASREGLITYLQCLLRLLDVHHDTEDKLAFPRFREYVDAPYDLLAAQHRQLCPLLEQARASVEQEAWTKLASVLRQIAELWHPHIGIEEEHFTVERFAALMPPQEHARLTVIFMEHTKQHATPDYLMVPFLLYNLPPDKRAFFAAEMPPVVTQELLPGPWKEKWAPMQPFLLA